MNNIEEEDCNFELKPGVYDYVSKVKEVINGDSAQNKIDEINNVLRMFNKDRDYDFNKDLQRYGKERIVSELDACLNIFNLEKMQPLVKEGLSYTQKINNEVQIKPFPIVFLFSPYKRIASAGEGSACLININEVRRKKNFNEEIVNCIAHESTHIFLKQLDKEPDWTKQDIKGRVCNFLWWEGVAKYVEPYPGYMDTIFENDSRFWISVVKRWFNSSNLDEKKEIINETMGRESFNSAVKYEYGENYSQLVENLSLSVKDEKSANDLFLSVIQMGGFGYYIGKEIWKDRIRKGYSVKDLVMEGSDEMSKWIEEYE